MASPNDLNLDGVYVMRAREITPTSKTRYPDPLETDSTPPSNNTASTDMSSMSIFNGGDYDAVIYAMQLNYDFGAQDGDEAVKIQKFSGGATLLSARPGRAADGSVTFKFGKLGMRVPSGFRLRFEGTMTSVGCQVWYSLVEAK